MDESKRGRVVAITCRRCGAPVESRPGRGNAQGGDVVARPNDPRARPSRSAVARFLRGAALGLGLGAVAATVALLCLGVVFS